MTEHTMIATSLVRYGPVVELNERECFTIAEDDEYWYDLCVMAFNHRLVMTPKDGPFGMWDWGWCFKDALSAVAAMAVWNPRTQNEPPGWHKRPTYQHVRVAPEVDEGDGANVARCEHGTYAGLKCRVVNCGR